jgi:hypothetical protein
MSTPLLPMVQASREAEYIRRHALASHPGACFQVLELDGGRGDTSRMRRDEYERVSRQRRFAWYRQCLRRHGPSDFNGINGTHQHAPLGCIASQEPCSLQSYQNGIILAHHLGDVEENVLSNVMHGMLPDALSGMREVGEVEGCPIWRPLLPHRKDIIYDFAHTYGVP